MIDLEAGTALPSWLAEGIRATTLEVELRTASARESALNAEVRRWQARAAALGRQVALRAQIEAGLRAAAGRLQQETASVLAAGNNYAAGNQALTARGAAAAGEADTYRRRVADLQQSLSWKITAPLRTLTRPLFRALSPPTGPRTAGGSPGKDE